jgi:hypothetical protein
VGAAEAFERVLSADLSGAVAEAAEAGEAFASVALPLAGAAALVVGAGEAEAGLEVDLACALVRGLPLTAMFWPCVFLMSCSKRAKSERMRASSFCCFSVWWKQKKAHQHNASPCSVYDARLLLPHRMASR